MNAIRFVHTDYCRLAGSVSGLAAAPDWLRRLARDATRGAVTRVFEIAANHQANFVLIAGDVSDAPEFDHSVAHWLQEPLNRLKRRGIRIVLAADRASSVDGLADVVLRRGERLQVKQSGQRLELSASAADSQPCAELVISPAQSGASHQAACNYLFQPGIRCACSTAESGIPVYTAGAPQSHGPEEQGESGCLVVDVDAGQGHVDVRIEETDPLRFETRTVDPGAVLTSQDICDAVVNASLDLARHQRQSSVVDWHIETPVECAGTIELWHQQSILESVRNTLQKGHLGVWPRRVVVAPACVRLSGMTDSQVIRELNSLLLSQVAESREEKNAVFAELITGTRLLSRAA